MVIPGRVVRLRSEYRMIKADRRWSSATAAEAEAGAESVVVVVGKG